jgi:hypothetical protein
MNPEITSGATSGSRVLRNVWVGLGLLAVGQVAALAVSYRMPVTVVGGGEQAEVVREVPEVVEVPREKVPVAEPVVALPVPVKDDPFADPRPQVAIDPEGPERVDPGMALLMEAKEKELLEKGGVALPGVSTGPRVAAAKVQAPLDVAITDEAVLAHLDEGLNLRSSGDTNGALAHLRAAAAVLPDHPKVLYHLALTLDTMGLVRKAQPVWESLRALGDGAGDFFVLARDRLRDGVEASAEPEEEREGKFTIGSLDEERVVDAGGERVRFTTVIRKKSDQPVDMEKMTLAIHFFDSVNGRSIARSGAMEPVLSCESEPADWADGGETFGFDYWQPAMSPDELQRLGRCRYYGCALEVIYEDKLQDATATTGELLQMARELPLPDRTAPDALLDSGPQPSPLVPTIPGSPENLLFPPATAPRAAPTAPR